MYFETFSGEVDAILLNALEIGCSAFCTQFISEYIQVYCDLPGFQRKMNRVCSFTRRKLNTDPVKLLFMND